MVAIKDCTLELPRLAMVRGSWLRGGAVLLALLLAGPLSARAEDEDHGDVLVLTDSNFDKIVNYEKIMVRAWAAPLRVATWVGGCLLRKRFCSGFLLCVSGAAFLTRCAPREQAIEFYAPVRACRGHRLRHSPAGGCRPRA